MNPQAEELNRIIKEKNPAVYDLLSERGKAIFFPRKGILGQSADAKGTKINATIGTAVEDDCSPMRLEAIASKINMAPEDVFPYAPSFGRLDLRNKWQELIYKKNPALGNQPISVPVATNALTHGISMAGYMFCDEGDKVIVSDLYWGNYNLTLMNAYNAKITTFNLFKENRFDIEAFKAKLEEDGIGKKIVLLNFPNNPSGYTPMKEEMKAIVEVILESAEKGNKIVAITDDAYFGLFFEEGVETQSGFAYLSNLHENVLAVKIDGPTKEDYVWGFRVGFLTYSIKGGDKDLYAALESKTAGAIRGNISNAANISQALLLQAYKDGDYENQKAAKHAMLKQRYEKVKEVLLDTKYSEYFTALPYNSGYFMCVKLVPGIDGEELRHLLISKYSIGIINLNNLIRVAFSGVAVSQIQELFDGLYEACKSIKK